MERTKGAIAAAAGFCLVLAAILFVTAATVCNMAGDRGLLAVEMRRHSAPKVSGLPEEHYQDMARMIAEYLTGKRDEFQYCYTDREGETVVCFRPHEVDHMADVRQLIRLAEVLRWIMAVMSLVLIVLGIVLRKYRKSYSSGMLAGFGVSAVSGMLILIWGIVNFGGFFTVFHMLAFTNFSWLLDARTDMLIRLMPASLFSSLGGKLLLTITAVALLALTAAVMLRMTGENKQEELAAGEAGCAAE